MTDFNAEIQFSGDASNAISAVKGLERATTDLAGTTQAAQDQLRSAMRGTEDAIQSLRGRLVQLYAERSRGDQTEALRQEIALTEKAVATLEGDLAKMSSALGGTAPAANQAASGMAGVAESAGMIGVAVAVAEKAVDLLTEAVGALFHGIQHTVEEGIDFNRTIETATIGIGTLIATQNDMRDANGRVLEGQEKLTAAQQLGAEAVNRIRTGSFQTVATFKELIAAYQQGLGPMQNAGLTLQQTTDLTIKFAQAAGALGLDMSTLGTELRATFNGQISARITRIASALHIRKEDLDDWKASGTLVENLNKRLEFFALAGPQIEASWQGVTSNMRHFFEAFAGEMTHPLFERIKTGLLDAFHGAFDATTGEFTREFQGLVQTGEGLFGVLGDLVADAFREGLTLAKALSAWLDDHKADMVGAFSDLLVVVRQVAGLVGDIVGDLGRVGGLTAEAGGGFSGLRTILQGVGLVVAVIRDTFKAVMAVAIDLGTYLLQGVMGPVQLVLIGIGHVMDYVNKGSGESLFQAAEAMQRLADKGHGIAQGMADDLTQGRSAVAQFGDQLLDAREKAEALGRAVKDAKGGGTGKDKPTATPHPHNEDNNLEASVQDEIALRIKALLESTSEKLTLAQKEEAESTAFLNKVRHESIQIDKAAAAGKITASQEAADRKALEESKEKGLQAIRDKYATERKQAQQKLDEQLQALEGLGLDRQLAQIRTKYEKLREEVRKAGLDQAQIERINAAERKEIRDAEFARVEADVKKLREHLAELEKEKGRALSFNEQAAEVARFGQAMGYASASIRQVTAEIARQRNGFAGWRAGLADFVQRGQNLFQAFKQAAMTVFNGIQSTFATVLQGLADGTLKVGNVLKALWKGITQTVIQALAQLAAQYITTAIAQQIMGKSSSEASKEVAVSSQISAAAEIFEANGSIPIVGPIIAAGLVALMEATLGANAVAARAITKNDKGGWYDKPTLGLFAEAGEPELAVPETMFLDWSKGMVGMGGALHASIMRDQVQTQSYDLQGARYASKAATAPAQQPGAAFHRGAFEGALRGAYIMDTSRRGMEQLADLLFDAVGHRMSQRTGTYQPNRPVKVGP